MSAVMMSQATYQMPILDVTGVLVLTNTTPCHPYRGAGRPEAIFYIERILDKAAREMGIDPAEIRRRNLVAPDAMPFHTHTHAIYDSGEFVATLDKCVERSDAPGYAARKKATEAKGRLRGRGLVYYIDNTGIFNERMEIRFDPSGSATIVAGTFSHGQGHETAYKQMVNQFLGVPFDQINFIQGDTDAVSFGRGTYGSRSMLSGGSALRMAADRIIEKGKAFAGMALEASASDIEFSDGMFTVKGTDKAMPVGAVAQFSYIPMGLPDELGVGLEASGTFDGAAHAYPNGAHVCELEVDPDTGKVYLDKYWVVDDIGNVINPLLAAGQIHGGIAQGVGQALLEDIKYDAESGQLLTGSFLDYCMPRADDLPSYDCGWNPVPCKTNAVGAKGAGEGGTVAATPAVINAIVDALSPYGVDTVPMPATPEVVWRAIQGGQAKAA
jgi:carbon-monoxide dehydrogenase large subunit